VFQLVVIAIFGPMICALLGVLVYTASREALLRLRTFFLNLPMRFKKKTEQNGRKQNYPVEGSKSLPFPHLKDPEKDVLQGYTFHQP